MKTSLFNRVKLYTYSDEQIAFVDTKWILTKIVLCGILAGSIIFFTFFTVNHSAWKIFRSDLANTFETENIILQEHVNLLSPKIYNLKMQTNHLIGRSIKFDKLLFRTASISDTDSGSAVNAKIFKFQSSLLVSANSFHDLQ